MTAQDERELAALARGGDRAAADVLARAVVPLVWSLAARVAWRHPAAERAELASVGLLAVARAVPLFDPARGHRWATYAGAAARREMWGAAVRAGELCARRGTDPDEPALDATPARAAYPPGCEPVELADLLGVLPPVSEQLVRLRFGIGCPALPLPQAARRVGLSRRAARDALAAALARLREAAT